MNDIAAAGQIVFENKVCELLNNLHDLYPEYDHVCLSGGIFANVKVNKRINELPWVKEVYITPPMGDEGLTLGSGLLYNSTNKKQDVFRLNDVYLGGDYNDIEIQNTIFDVKFKDKFVCEDLDVDRVAKLLDEQHIVGLFQGRMEYGPRALGNRTILADARSAEAYDKLNDRLNRNDCMPFAPVVLAEYADDIFKIEKSRYTAEFMTMLYDTRIDWHDRIPSALHPIDKTARIQLVYEEKNKLLYDILKSFYIRTSVPVLINTSFNIHEEPIVCWPENAFDHLVNGIVDYLIVENKLYSLKK
jgi:carbamoyltransferase